MFCSLVKLLMVSVGMLLSSLSFATQSQAGFDVGINDYLLHLFFNPLQRIPMFTPEGSMTDLSKIYRL